LEKKDDIYIIPLAKTTIAYRNTSDRAREWQQKKKQKRLYKKAT